RCAGRGSDGVAVAGHDHARADGVGDRSRARRRPRPALGSAPRQRDRPHGALRDDPRDVDPRVRGGRDRAAGLRTAARLVPHRGHRCGMAGVLPPAGAGHRPLRSRLDHPAHARQRRRLDGLRLRAHPAGQGHAPPPHRRTARHAQLGGARADVRRDRPRVPSGRRRRGGGHLQPPRDRTAPLRRHPHARGTDDRGGAVREPVERARHRPPGGRHLRAAPGRGRPGARGREDRGRRVRTHAPGAPRRLRRDRRADRGGEGARRWGGIDRVERHDDVAPGRVRGGHGAPGAGDGIGEDVAMSEETDRQAEQLSEEARTFVEDFAFSWGAAGNPRMDGRVLGLLLIVDRPFLSSAQIAEMLGASAGAVSMSTRAL
ncbi:hypothetical protein FF38_06605, partial [Lucilia cuprina]